VISNTQRLQIREWSNNTDGALRYRRNFQIVRSPRGQRDDPSSSNNDWGSSIALDNGGSSIALDNGTISDELYFESGASYTILLLGDDINDAIPAMYSLSAGYSALRPW
jgi:hypothetical protein